VGGSRGGSAGRSRKGRGRREGPDGIGRLLKADHAEKGAVGRAGRTASGNCWKGVSSGRAQRDRPPLASAFAKVDRAGDAGRDPRRFGSARRPQAGSPQAWAETVILVTIRLLIRLFAWARRYDLV
jgi:hypothetical protein